MTSKLIGIHDKEPASDNHIPDQSWPNEEGVSQHGLLAPAPPSSRLPVTCMCERECRIFWWSSDKTHPRRRNRHRRRCPYFVCIVAVFLMNWMQAVILVQVYTMIRSRFRYLLGQRYGSNSIPRPIALSPNLRHQLPVPFPKRQRQGGHLKQRKVRLGSADLHPGAVICVLKV